MFEMTYGSKPSTPVKRYIHIQSIPTNNYKCPKKGVAGVICMYTNFANSGI